MSKIKLLFIFAVIFCGMHAASATDYQVTDFGVKADGVTLNTSGVQRAIDYANENGGGRVVFTPGRYLIGSIYLKSNVTLHLERGAVLLGSTNAFDYVKEPICGGWMAMIFACRQENVAITGKGTIDGQGIKTANSMLKYIQKGIFTDDAPLDRPREWNRPVNIYIRECNNVKIQGVSIVDPACWNQIYDRCDGVIIDDIYVNACNYWNNDGLDVVDSKNVVVKNSFISSSDDAFCFKSHNKDFMCENVIMDNCVARSSASALKFGTMTLGGFRNFKITNLTVYDTYRSAITFATVDGGMVEDILVDGVRSYNTWNVIFLRFGLRNTAGYYKSFKNVTIQNVYAEVPARKPDLGYGYEGPVEDNPRNILPAVIFGLADHHIQDVTLRNIEIHYPGGGNKYYAYRGCSDEELEAIPDMEKSYPEYSQWKELPAWGFFVRHADNITFDNVRLVAEDGGDYRPAFIASDVNGLKIDNLNIEEPASEGKNQIVLHKTTKR